MPLAYSGATLARSDDRRDVVLRRLEARPHFAVTDPVHGQVGGQHERREPGLECLLDDVVAHAAVAEDVELEPPRRARRSGGDLCRGGRRDRGDAHERSGGTSATRHRDLPLLVRDLLERHRRDEHGQRHRRPEHRRLRRDGRDVDEDAVAQPEAGERLAVPAQRPLVAGSADDVAPRLGRDDRLREALGVVDREELLHGRGA